jgi:hypothetical protein
MTPGTGREEADVAQGWLLSFGFAPEPASGIKPELLTTSSGTGTGTADLSKGATESV